MCDLISEASKEELTVNTPIYKIPKDTLAAKFTEKGVGKQGIEVGIKHRCSKHKTCTAKRIKAEYDSSHGMG
jgi:hypothetical protein